jgi:hypothetical protein
MVSPASGMLAVGMPRSLEPRPKPLTTGPRSLSGNGGWTPAPGQHRASGCGASERRTVWPGDGVAGGIWAAHAVSSVFPAVCRGKEPGDRGLGVAARRGCRCGRGVFGWFVNGGPAFTFAGAEGLLMKHRSDFVRTTSGSANPQVYTKSIALQCTSPLQRSSLCRSWTPSSSAPSVSRAQPPSEFLHRGLAAYASPAP